MLHTLHRTWQILDRRLRVRWSVVLALSLLTTVLETSGSLLIFALINLISNPASVSRYPLVGPQLTEWMAADAQTVTVAMGVAIALFFAVKNLAMLGQIYLQEVVTVSSVIEGARRRLATYMRAPLTFHLRNNSSKLSHDADYAVSFAVRSALLSGAVVLTECLVLAGLVLVLVLSEPLVTLVTGAVLGVMIGLTLLVTQRHFGRWGAEMQLHQRASLKEVQQCLGSFKEVRLLGRENYFQKQVLSHWIARGRIQRLAQTVSNAPRLAMETALVVGLVVIIVMLFAQNRAQAEIMPLLGLFAYTGFRMLPSLNRIVMNANNIRFAADAIDSLYYDLTTLEASVAVTNSADAPAVAFEHKVELQHIVYSYPSAERRSLDGIDLVIRKGQSLGIVGPTGSGKSTLVDVLLGLLKPDEGRLLVDGVDVTDAPANWQRLIGYVPQSIFLTDDTLRRNIAFGLPDEEIDDAKVMAAATLAQVLEYIDALPEGLNTMVGERGVRLSGGQRQRIGIARALYHQPGLLVFDEATSALDNETEREVTRAIERLAGCKTVVLIAHRLTTVQNCDHLIFLRDGRIDAEGPFETLLARSPTFRRLALGGEHESNTP